MQIVTDILNELVENIMSDTNEMEYDFKKGHLSMENLYHFQEEERLPNINLDEDVCECPYFCILCLVCNLPAGPNDMFDVSIAVCIQSCLCCNRSCNFKRILFNVIGDAIANEDLRKRKQNLEQI